MPLIRQQGTDAALIECDNCHRHFAEPFNPYRDWSSNCPSCRGMLEQEIALHSPFASAVAVAPQVRTKPAVSILCQFCGDVLSNPSKIYTMQGSPACSSCFLENKKCRNCKKTFHRQNVSRVSSYREDGTVTAIPLCNFCRSVFHSHIAKATGFDLTNGIERYYGLEFETIAPHAWQTECDNDDDNWEPPTFEFFTPGEDGSIDGDGVEYRSHIMQGNTGMMTTENFLHRLKRNGFKVNRSCGFHVHIDARDIKEKSLVNIASFIRAFDGLLFALMPSNRRGNQYAGRFSFTKEALREAKDYAWRFRPTFSGRSRYKGFNLQSLFKYGTIEFRYHGGTLDFNKARHWIVTCLSIIESQKDHFWRYPKRYEFLRPSLKNLNRFMVALSLPKETKTYLTQRYNRFNGE